MHKSRFRSLFYPCAPSYYWLEQYPEMENVEDIYELLRGVEPRHYDCPEQENMRTERFNLDNWLFWLATHPEPAVTAFFSVGVFCWAMRNIRVYRKTLYDLLDPYPDMQQAYTALEEYVSERKEVVSNTLLPGQHWNRYSNIRIRTDNAYEKLRVNTNTELLIAHGILIVVTRRATVYQALGQILRNSEEACKNPGAFEAYLAQIRQHLLTLPNPYIGGDL